MFNLLFPYEYVDSVFSIDYKKLLQKGYKGIPTEPIQQQK